MSAAYCTVAEITTLGINPAALVDIDPEQAAAAIAAVSDEMDGYFSAQFKLPLLTFGSDVKTCCAVLAATQLLRTRGYDPEADPSVSENFKTKLSWLRDIARGIVRPRVVDSAPAATVGLPSGGPRVVSSPSQGFSRLPGSSTWGGGCGPGGSFGA